MELEGEIIEIIYKNELNSYCIAVMQTSTDDEITIVGYLPFINVGDTIKVVGKIVEHQEYGEQFKVDTFEKIDLYVLARLEEVKNKVIDNRNSKKKNSNDYKKLKNHLCNFLNAHKNLVVLNFHQENRNIFFHKIISDYNDYNYF